MRAIVTSLDDFINELKTNAGKITAPVRARIDLTEKGEDSPVVDVGFWATAIVPGLGGSETYLLELSLYAGEDVYPDRLAGTSMADGWRKKLGTACERFGMTLIEGKWELW